MAYSVEQRVKKRRLHGIDAARGTAMLFVCLAHFAYEYFSAPTAPDAALLFAVTLIASPTFMLISGMMLGLLFATRRAGFAELTLDLRGRGIFLLTVGHALILISCLPRLGLTAALTRGFITDVIGVAIIVGPFLMPRLAPRSRLALAVGLFALGATLAWGWAPTGAILSTLDFALAGSNFGDPRANFPALQWMAVYLVGTVLGERLGAAFLAGAPGKAERLLVVSGALLIGLAVLVKGGFMLLRSFGVVASGETMAYAATSVFTKFPPALPYLALYGGAGLWMTATVLRVARAGLVPRAIDALAVLGRASLFVFLLQFFVYYVGFYYLALDYRSYWPVIFFASVAFIWVCAIGWLALGLNRVFDVTRWFGRRPGTGAHPAPVPGEA